MKKIFFLSLLIFFISAYLFLFNTSFASAITIVGCETSGSPVPCNLCEVFQMASRAIRFALYIVLPGLAAFAFMIAGAILLFAGGNESNVKTGHGIIKVTVYGILIAFCGWLIINTIMVELVNPNVFNWWQVWYKVPDCSAEATPNMPTPAVSQPGVIISTGDVQKIIFNTVPAKETRELLNKAGINIIDSTGKINQTCEDQKLDPEKDTCTSTANVPDKVIADIIDLNEILKEKLKRNTDIALIGFQETKGHTDGTKHGDGFTIDINNPDTTMIDYVNNHKDDLNIRRTGCMKGCDFSDNGLHIEFEKSI